MRVLISILMMMSMPAAAQTNLDEYFDQGPSLESSVLKEKEQEALRKTKSKKVARKRAKPSKSKVATSGL